MNIIETDNKYVAHSYGRYPICITSGKGSVLYGDDGKEYIDFVYTWNYNNLWYNNYTTIFIYCNKF